MYQNQKNTSSLRSTFQSYSIDWSKKKKEKKFLRFHVAFHGRIFGWLPWQWTWAISFDGMRTHNYTRGRASYVPTRCVLCFEMQRAMHRSHGNKRGTIGSRSTSAVILTKYSAVLKCSEMRL